VDFRFNFLINFGLDQAVSCNLQYCELLVNSIVQTCSLQKRSVPLFRKQLLRWYGAYRRDLPWRVDRDPYRVWLSEIMLQQTRVAAVIEHYHKFLRRFPTIEKLAAAREASVLAAWSGLGYYRRARMMHAAAKVIVREHSGRFPMSAERLRTLPGIGRYTAAAIASIAFSEPVAVVDGNVERVLQRVFGKRLAGEEIWQAAGHLLDAERPGDFNQAMMELGATVCTPRSPGCLTCPVVDLCATRGELAALSKPAPQRKREIHHALVIRNGNARNGNASDGNGRNRTKKDKAVLLVQRPQNASLMAGMWELPQQEEPAEQSEPLFTLRHSITITDYTVRVWRNIPSDSNGGTWVPMARLSKLPLTGLARKILKRASFLD
jgi:A/G-specific adenine glycosylase